METTAGDLADDGSVNRGSDSADSSVAVSGPELDLAPELDEHREASILFFPTEPRPVLVAEPAHATEATRPVERVASIEPAQPTAGVVRRFVEPARDEPVEPAALAQPVVPAGPAHPVGPAQTIGTSVALTAAPCVELAASLACLNPSLLSGREILDGIAGFDRLLSWMTGLQQQWLTTAAVPGAVVEKDAAAAMAEVREDVDFDLLQDEQPESAQALLVKHTIHLAGQELAPLLAMANSTAKLRITAATDIVTNLPMIHRAILEGVLNPYRASLIAAGTTTMTGDTRRLAAQILLNHGAKLGISRLKKLIRKTVATLDRDAFNALAKEARRQRDVQMFTDDHGMARLWAILPADQAVLIQGIIDELANHLFKIQQGNSDIPLGSEEWRSKGEMRADAFAEIMLSLATTGFVDVRDYLKSEPSDPAKPESSPLGSKTVASQPQPAASTGTHARNSGVNAGAANTADITATTADIADTTADIAATTAGPATQADTADTKADTADTKAHTADTADTKADTAGTASSRVNATGTDMDSMADESATSIPWSGNADAAAGYADNPSPAIRSSSIAGSTAGNHCSEADLAVANLQPAVELQPVVELQAPVERESEAEPEHGDPHLRRSFDAPPNLTKPLIKPTGLNLTMSLETLLQLRNEPGYLNTFDTIPDYLRDGILQSAASVTVMLLDNCGTLLDLGKTARFPNAKLSKYLEQRDVSCRFPGCNNDARRADLDHQQAWKVSSAEAAQDHSAAVRRTAGTVTEEQFSSASGNCTSGRPNVPGSNDFLGNQAADNQAVGNQAADNHAADSHAADNQAAGYHSVTTHAAGETCASNMAALCRTHHLMKHHTDWQVQHEINHNLSWISPNGHRHSTAPSDWRLTLPAEQIAQAQLQISARKAAEAQEAARIQAEFDAKYPDIAPF